MDRAMMACVFIGIGSNVGDRQGYIDLARARLGELDGTVLAGFSPVYETAPVGPIKQGAFLNAAARIETTLSPRELLAALVGIEKQAGRPGQESGGAGGAGGAGGRVKWGPRTLDLDILLYGDCVVSEDGLEIPHPLMHEREFVLLPLAQVGGEVVHPVLGVTVEELLSRERRGEK